MVPLETIEDLVGGRSLVQILLPKVRIHDVRYVVDVDNTSPNLSQFVHNFVEIYH